MISAKDSLGKRGTAFSNLTWLHGINTTPNFERSKVKKCCVKIVNVDLTELDCDENYQKLNKNKCCAKLVIVDLIELVLSKSSCNKCSGQASGACQ